MSHLKQLSLHIKPLCDEIIKNPSVEVIDSLNEELKLVENQYLQQFRDFILLPIIAQIDDIYVVNKNEIKTHLITCIITLLEKIRLDKVVPLKTVLIVLLKQIYDVNTGLIVKDLSEELKLNIIECIDLSMRRLMSSVVEEFYVDENAKLIAQICHVCVQLVQSESYKKLKISSMKCILGIFQLHDEADFSDVVLRRQISNMVFIILPKIFTTFYHVAQEDDSKGVGLKIMALKAIRLVLTLIFEEYDLTGEKNCFSVIEIKNAMKNGFTKTTDRTDEEILGMNIKSTRDPAKKLQALENIRKTDEWFNAASKKLKLSLSQFVKLRSNQNQEVRFALALLNCELIIKCALNMKPCVQHFLETIITLSEDPDTAISNLCSSTLDSLFSNGRYFNLMFDIQILFKSHIVSLPRIICREDAEELNAALMLLLAYIKVLSDTKLKSVLSDEDILEKLLVVLITSVQLDISNDLLLEEHSLRDSQEIIEYNDNNLPWKKFKYLTTLQTQKCIMKICKLLGSSSASSIIFTYLLDSFYSNPSSSNEILILLDYCIRHSNNRMTIQNVMDEYLLPYHWNLTIHCNTDTNIKELHDTENSIWYEIKTAGLYEGQMEMRYTDVKYRDDVSSDLEMQQITIGDSKLHILHTCLVVEMTGNLAILMKDNFHNFLFKTFHRFLEKAGSSNYMIHMSGMYALNKLRESFGISRISDLIFATSDYLIYHLKILFRKNEYNRTGLDILCVVLKYSSILLLPYLQTIVSDVLSIDLYQRNDKTSFLKLFEICIYAINQWTTKTKAGAIVNGSDNDKKVEDLNEESAAHPYDSVINDFIEYMENEIEPSIKQQFDEMDDEGNPESVLNNEDHNAEYEGTGEIKIETKPELPQPIALTLSILNVCVKYISSKNQTEQLIVLRTINEGVKILKNHENELLPFIHSLWTCLLQRFHEKNVIVVRSSLTLVVTLAELSKDFIRDRVSKKLVPALNSFLQESAKENLISMKENNNITLQQNFKLQNEILQNYSTLITYLEIDDRILNSILDTTIVYANSQQPKILQESFFKFAYSLMLYDPTTVIVKIMHLDNNLINDIMKDIYSYNKSLIYNNVK